MRRPRFLLLPVALCSLLSAAPILTGCDEGPTSSTKCCKVCTAGKACGDTCIAKELTCSKAGGCACNG